MTATAERTRLAQAALSSASARTEPSATEGAAAAAASTAGSERPVEKMDLRDSPTAAHKSHSKTTHYSSSTHLEKPVMDGNAFMFKVTECVQLSGVTELEDIVEKNKTLT